MSLQCGIVGLPNVGKSTLFNALTSAGAEMANYPFCTIDPNVGVVAVPDVRMASLNRLVLSQKEIPAIMEFLDIAGLIAGASNGEGLGNRFLGNIRQVHAIVHVVRCFEHEDIVHAYDAIDPVRDMEVVETELMLADLATVEKRLARVVKTAKTGEKSARAALLLYERVAAGLSDGLPVRRQALDDASRNHLKDLFLLTAKPVLYVCNVGESGDDVHVKAVQAVAQSEGAGVIVLCGAMEAEVAELPQEERMPFLEALGLAESSLDRVIRAAYRLLGLITFFTAGPKEIRAWTITQGALAPEAAGVIHDDFRHGFICAEVISYDDFVACGGEQGSKEQGKLRLEGKTYVVRDGDVIHFRFNV